MKGFAVASLLTLCVAAASAQSLRTQIVSSYKELDRLILARDVDGFAKKLRPQVAKDFVYVEGPQKMTFDQMIAGMKMGLGGMKKMERSESKVLTVKEKGNSAVATIWTLTAGAAPGPDKKSHKMAFEGTNESTYVKQGGKWLLKRLTWIKQKMTMDGKPMVAPQATSNH